MNKYRLSHHIVISALEKDDSTPSIYREGYSILYNKHKDKEYLINSTINYFIEKFRTPKTLKEVLLEVQQELHSTNTEIEKTCSRFFEFLYGLKIVVAEDKVEKTTLDSPLFKRGDVIGNMHIVSVLSNRRYTDLYIARHTTGNGRYALKLLNKNKADGNRFADEYEELKREYGMLKKVGHLSAINSVYDFNTTADGCPYLVLEYIPGKSLTKYLSTTKTLKGSDCVTLIEAILKAFSSLHESNIIHGDVHASNLLITNKKTVKIIDLGFARPVAIQENEVVHSGGVCYYMPPERINITTVNKYSKEADLCSDVYQIGLLLYLTLYKELPFEGFIWEELAQNIKEAEIVYPELSYLQYPVPAYLIAIIKKCVNKKPQKRYKNATEILADFKKGAVAEKAPLCEQA